MSNLEGANKIASKVVFAADLPASIGFLLVTEALPLLFLAFKIIAAAQKPNLLLSAEEGQGNAFCELCYRRDWWEHRRLVAGRSRASCHRRQKISGVNSYAKDAIDALIVESKR